RGAVKLLFDENLSYKLVDRVSELYPGSTHVSQAGLRERSDRDIWEFAKENEFVLVSADSDFYALATTVGPPPKVVWLRRWTHPTRRNSYGARRFELWSSRRSPNWGFWFWIIRPVDLRSSGYPPFSESINALNIALQR